MAINKNHEFEELDGIKCGVVEKNVLPVRAQFLRELLELNGFTVVIVPTPVPKTTALPAAKPEDGTAPVPLPPPVVTAETFTVGVTDYTFNSINAIFGRLLKSPNGHVVTLAYWQQKEKESKDDIPYFDHKGNQ